MFAPRDNGFKIVTLLATPATPLFVRNATSGFVPQVEYEKTAVADDTAPIRPVAMNLICPGRTRPQSPGTGNAEVCRSACAG